MPRIISAALPGVLGAANPGSMLKTALGGVLGASPAKVGSGNARETIAVLTTAAPTDPAYAAAAEVRDLANHFYQYLDGDSGEVDMAKFASEPEASKPTTTATPSFTESKDQKKPMNTKAIPDTNTEKPSLVPNAPSTSSTSGISYLFATLKAQKDKTTVLDTAVNKKLMSANGKLIKVSKSETVDYFPLDITDSQLTRVQLPHVQTATAIQDYIKKETSATPAQPEIAVLTGWEKIVTEARSIVLQLTTEAIAIDSNNVLNVFTNLFNTPKTSTPSAEVRNAQLSGVMQNLQNVQNVLDTNFDVSVVRQSKMAVAMAEVEVMIKILQEKGPTLEEIKKVLKDCVSVLTDLASQIAKIDRFLNMLTVVIDEIIMPRTEALVRMLGRATGNGVLTVDQN